MIQLGIITPKIAFFGCQRYHDHPIEKSTRPPLRLAVDLRPDAVPAELRREADLGRQRLVPVPANDVQKTDLDRIIDME